MPFKFEEDRQRYLRQFGIAAWYLRDEAANARKRSRIYFRNDFSEVNSDNEVLIRSRPSSPHGTESGNSPVVGHFTGGEDSLSADVVNRASKTVSGKAIPDKVVTASVRETLNASRAELVDTEPSPVQENLGDLPALSSPDSSEKSVSAGSEEIWSKYSVEVGSDNSPSKVVFVAQMSPLTLHAERTLFQNLLQALLRSEAAPNLEEFKWPPFAQTRLPAQNNTTRQALLMRWVADTDADQQIVFSNQRLPELSSACYLPELSSMLLAPDSKHAVWKRLRVLDFLL